MLCATHSDVDLAALAQNFSLKVLFSMAMATAAVTHAASLLGRVTHAANNHMVEVVGEDGSTSFKSFRMFTFSHILDGARPLESDLAGLAWVSTSLPEGFMAEVS